MGDDSLSATDETRRHRRALEQALTAIDPDRAAYWAHRLIGEFGSLGGVMSASKEARTRVCGSIDAAELLESMAGLTRLWLRERAWSGPVLGDGDALLDYLRASQAAGSSETLRVLFLNARNMLMRDEMVVPGTIDEAPIWPREILRRSLEVNAAGIILVHNHPSGDHAPSIADIEVTRRLATTCEDLGVLLHDHIICSRGGHSSMRALGLL